MKYSSTTTWIETIICATRIRRSPVITCDAEADPVPLLIRSPTPTTMSPKNTHNIPLHLVSEMCEPRNPTDKSPEKMITAPRSIWKLLAEVRLRPRYMVLVARMSQQEGARKMRGLNRFGIRGFIVRLNAKKTKEETHHKK